MFWRGTPDGKRLPGMSKAIATNLILRAQQRFRYKCIVTDEELAADLDCHRDSIKKYLDPLVELQLITYERKGERGRKIYDCIGLFKKFGEERSEPKSKVADLRAGQMPKDSASSQTPKVSATAKTDAESFLADAESFAADAETVDSDAESFGDSSNPSSTSFVSSLLNVAELGKQLGISNTEGLERDVFAIADNLTRLGFTKRRQKYLVRRHGIAAVTGAIGYVLEQLRLHPGAIRSPDGLLMYALKEGHMIEIRDERQSPKVSASGPAVRFGASLQDAVKEHLRTRLPEAFFGMFVQPLTIEVEGATMTLRCPSAFVAGHVRDRRVAFEEAAFALLGTSLTVDVAVK